MKTPSLYLLALTINFLLLAGCTKVEQNKAVVTGELKQWHKVTLTITGPFASETDTDPNPFTDYRMDVVFTHESGSPSYTVPGYFAADGNAAETSADSGDQWRAHLSPDRTGRWDYHVSFKLNEQPTEWDGISGSIQISDTDKTGRDFRAHGRLQYVGKRYLQFADSGEYFLKAGADAPETLLAYEDFDGTYSAKPAGIIRQGEAISSNLKTWKPHVQDWREGDPTWQGGKGKGLIGAINYLASTGCNTFSFLTYNAGGDGDNVWPHVSREDKLHMDVSKLDQWGIVFEHGTSLGMYLHFKLQETENDDLNHKNEDSTAQALDGGDLGPQRKLYLRELIARFGHNLALNWNLGEENTQTIEQQKAMAGFIRETDPYGHNIVLHTYPNRHDEIYGALLGDKEALTGLSIQNSDVAVTHAEAVKWVEASEKSGHPWVVAHDEPGNAALGTPPDPDYPGMAEAKAALEQERLKPDADLNRLKLPTVDDVRKQVLWGQLLAGGAGVEYYFGYKLPQNDLNCEDWRSRSLTWKWSAIALQFFKDHEIPFWEMHSADDLVGNFENDNTVYCFAKPGEIYLLYMPGNQVTLMNILDMMKDEGIYTVKWFNPREGGPLQEGQVTQILGNGIRDLGPPPADPLQDWLIVVQRD